MMGAQATKAAAKKHARKVRKTKEKEDFNRGTKIYFRMKSAVLRGVSFIWPDLGDRWADAARRVLADHFSPPPYGYSLIDEGGWIGLRGPEQVGAKLPTRPTKQSVMEMRRETVNAVDPEEGDE